eukprot:151317-Chlamydomonas_euryale.AAC.4
MQRGPHLRGVVRLLKPAADNAHDTKVGGWTTGKIQRHACTPQTPSHTSHPFLSHFGSSLPAPLFSSLLKPSPSRQPWGLLTCRSPRAPPTARCPPRCGPPWRGTGCGGPSPCPRPPCCRAARLRRRRPMRCCARRPGRPPCRCPAAGPPA